MSEEEIKKFYEEELEIKFIQKEERKEDVNNE